MRHEIKKPNDKVNKINKKKIKKKKKKKNVTKIIKKTNYIIKNKKLRVTPLY